jgi:hypothetical protein
VNSSFKVMSVYRLAASLLERKLNSKQINNLLVKNRKESLALSVKFIWISTCESIHSTLYSIKRDENHAKRIDATSTVSQGVKFSKLGEFVVVRKKRVQDIIIGKNKGQVDLLLSSRLLLNMQSKQSKRPTLERGSSRKPSSQLSYVGLARRCGCSKEVLTVVLDTVVQTFSEHGCRGNRLVLPLGPLGEIVSNGRGTVVHRHSNTGSTSSPSLEKTVELDEAPPSLSSSTSRPSTASSERSDRSNSGVNNVTKKTRFNRGGGMFASGNGILKWNDGNDGGTTTKNTRRPVGRGGGQEREAKESTFRRKRNARLNVSGNRRESSQYELDGRKKTLEELVILCTAFTALDRITEAHLSGNSKINMLFMFFVHFVLIYSL